MELKKQSFLFLKEDWTFLCEEEQEINKNFKQIKEEKEKTWKLRQWNLVEGNKRRKKRWSYQVVGDEILISINCSLI